MNRSLIALLLALLLAACATPGARPRDMSAAGHEAAAAQSGNVDRAAAHREAASVLRQRAAAACAGLALAERASSPLIGAGIVTAAPAYPRSHSDKRSPLRRLAGAILVVRPEPGVTQQRLQQLLECHIAHAALREPGESMRDCPLAVPGAIASARSFGPGFAIEIDADEPGSDEAETIWKRASRLLAAQRPLASFRE